MEVRAPGGVRSYVSPILIEHNGTRMIVITTSEDIMAVDPDNGEIFWNIDLVTEYGCGGRRNNTNTPSITMDGEIYTTTGYDDQGSDAETFGRRKICRSEMDNDGLDMHHGGVVLLDGYLYGANWINNGNGNWVCQEWESGKVMYEEKWHNKGSIIYADGLLYIFEEKQGHVGLLNPSPEGFKLISEFQIEAGEGPFWAHMSIYDKKLFIRHGTVLFVYDIAE